LVRKKADQWEIIAGERRFRAAQKLGMLTVPAIEIQASDVESLELALIENLQRSDLSPLEEAEGYQRLQEAFDMTQEQISQKVGKDRATVANAIRLLRLAPDIKSLLASGELTAGHARVLAALPTPQEQRKLADKIIHQGFTVRDAEKWLQNQKGPTKKGKPAGKAKDPNVAKLEEGLRNWLGTKVTLKTQGKEKGTVCFEYYSLDDLDRILNLFRKAGFRS
jgi:ParB family transcriptional regulator, chromosome partitioning protein